MADDRDLWGPPLTDTDIEPVPEIRPGKLAEFATDVGLLAFDTNNGFVPYAGRYVLPRLFNMLIDSNEYETQLLVEIEVKDTGAECSRLSFIRRPDGPPVTGAGSRVPLDAIVKNCLVVAAFEIQADSDGNLTTKHVASDADKANAFLATYRSTTHTSRRGVRVTDVTLERVAATYRAAIRDKRSPNKVIAEVFQISPHTAPKWVAKARDRGFLGPAVGTRAGEQPKGDDDGEAINRVDR